MLAIRLQRKGRSGHAQFRVIVQDSRYSPKSGKIVEYLGSYDPHSKTATIDKEKAEEFLKNGAQPSNRAAKILQAEKVKLPGWVEIDTSKKGKLKDAEKLRKNRPDEPEEEQPEPDADAKDEKPETEETAKADEQSEPEQEKPEAANDKGGEDGSEAKDESSESDEKDKKEDEKPGEAESDGKDDNEKDKKES